MDYIKKICPICRNEFVVLDIVEEKAVYCTLKCLLESQEKIDKNRLSFLETQYNLYNLH
jgi:hypothetical protein